MERKSLLEGITALLVCAVMIFCAADVSAFADSYFYGKLTADDAGIALGGISVDIYGSKLRYSSNGLKRYEHYYVKTVETKPDGSFSFARPTKKTLLKIDLYSLPAGTGADAKTRLVSGSRGEGFSLSYVDRIAVDAAKDGTVYKVTLRSGSGDTLFAEYDIDEEVSADFTDVTYESLNSVKLEKTVTVTTDTLTKTRTFPLDISNCTVAGKLSRLLEYGMIDEITAEEIMNVYTEDTSTIGDERPVYYDERTFTAGNFMFHCESASENKELYSRILSGIVDTYFTEYGFLEPYHEFLRDGSGKRDPYFHIYLADPDAIKIDSQVAPMNVVGRTKKADVTDVTKGCYIILGPAAEDSFTKTLSHEIFHCIIFRYMDKNPASWFGEAFANYGSMLCLNGSVRSLNTQIGYYLSSPGYSLNDSSSYKYRHYGDTLLPLYIHNKLGGAETIKNILKAYKSASGAYSAIDKGLKKTSSSYSFASLFAGFKDMNAYTAFYRVPDTSAGTKSVGFGRNAVRTTTAKLGSADTYAIPVTDLPGNSAAYFEFTAPDSGKGTLTVTLETFSGDSWTSYNLILKGKKITIPSRGKAYPLMSFELSDFGMGGITNAVLTAGNTSASASVRSVFEAVAYYKA